MRDGDIHEQTTVGGVPADDGLVRAPGSASTRDVHSRRLEPSIEPGDVLGRYRIVERLGEGGMGVVYRAFDPQLKRDVALKIMRPTAGGDTLGHATEAMLREARALAQLSHPNVVEIFDVGTFSGQVFMAMELLHGITLTKWLLRGTPKNREGRRKDRRWREVVDALVKAGQGLAAAHERGVVHRDFKPDNVVITDEGWVRVVDFGLATPETVTIRDRPHRWFNETDSRTDPSVTGVVAGTPPYMSPEQLRGEAVDARSDQFSFCVALFRALHRVRPYKGGSIDTLLVDMERRGRPVAVRRRASGAVHRAMLRGLSVDPDLRWPSMDALLEALQPRPSGRRGVVLAVGGFAALTVGATLLRPPAVSCEPPSQATEVWSDEALGQLEHALQDSGLRYAQESWGRFEPRYRGLGEHWVETYAEICEGRGRGERDALQADRAVACLYQSLESAQTLAEVVREGDHEVLGRIDEALAAVPDPQRCLAGGDDEGERRGDLRQGGHGPRFARAKMLAKVGRYADALAIIDELKEQAEGEAQWRWRVVLDTEAGYLLDFLGKYDEAVARLEPAALEARSRRDDVLAAWAAVRLMRTLGQRLSRVDEGMQWMRFIESSLAGVEEGDGSDDLDNLPETLHYTHAGILFAKGDHAAAMEAYGQALTLCEAADGKEGLRCTYLEISISSVLDAMGRHEEARDSYERALALYEKNLGPWHPKLATPTDNLGIVLYRLGDFEGAVEKHARSLEIREAAFGPDNAEVGLSLTNLGLAELELERLADSRKHQERAVENWRKSLGEEHPYVAAAITNLALVRSLEGASADELITLHRQALQIREAALGAEHPEVGTSLANLGNALTDKGDYDDARRQLDRARALWVKAYGEGSERVASIDIDLGDLAKEQEAWDDAATFFERARQSYEEKLGPEHGSAVWVRYKLGHVELQRGDLARAKELIERAQRELEAMPTEIYRRALSTFGLARLRAAEGEREQARTLAREAKARTKELEATDSRGPELREEVDAWLARGMRDGG